MRGIGFHERREQQMRWPLTIASVVVSLLTGSLATSMIVKDRQEAIARASERTSSMSRMIIANGDASASIAEQVVSVALPLVAQWDLRDAAKGKDLHDRLRLLVGNNSDVAAAAVLDGRGNLLVTSRDFPVQPLNLADRPFFGMHAAGSPGPLIAGDEAAGPVSGKKRFTFSQSDLNPNGSLRAIVVVAIYTSGMDILYAEAANWPGSRAGLYAVGGDVLAQAKTVSRASRPFLLDVETHAANAASGTIISNAEPETRIVSWNRSEIYPSMYSAASQSMSEALKAWRSRAWMIVAFTIVANLLFWAFAHFAARSTQAQQAIKAQDLAMREVHHRLKNSLQLISSLIRMRSAKYSDPMIKAVVDDITSDLRAIAEVHSLVQTASSLGEVDIAHTVETLCSHLRKTYRAEVSCDTAGPIVISATHATSLSVIVNELVTNAVKHGGGQIAVRCWKAEEQLHIAVTNNGTALPNDFTVEAATGFGLRALRALVSGFDGKITAANDRDGSATFLVTVPMAALLK
jgi:two-component sensor histidine kinase